MSVNRKAVLVETFNAAGQNHLGLLAAGVAFYMFFAIIPGLGVAVWLLGLLTNPAAIQGEADNLRDVLPQEALSLIQQQLIALTSRQSGGVSLPGLINLVIALFTARTAASSMIEALNHVYGVQETRGIIKVNAIAVLFTIVAVITLVAAIMLAILLPELHRFASSSGPLQVLVRYLRWPLLAFLAILALAVVYRFGPDREKPSWHWLTWGSIAAASLWLVVSFGFSWYVAVFNSYDRLYGSLGAVIVLLFWFWLTAFSGLLGAQLDRQIELQSGQKAQNAINRA